MMLSLLGIIGIALSPNYGWLLLSVVLIGLGSALFHPEGLEGRTYGCRGTAGTGTVHLSVSGQYRKLDAVTAYAVYFPALRSDRSAVVHLRAGAAVVISYLVSRWYMANLRLVGPKSAAAKPSAAKVGAPQQQREASETRG